jgi:hypothetical protein
LNHNGKFQENGEGVDLARVAHSPKHTLYLV